MARDEEVVTESTTPVVESAPVTETSNTENAPVVTDSVETSTETPAPEAAKPAGPSADEVAKLVDNFRVKVFGDEADPESGTEAVEGLIAQKDTATGALPEGVVSEIKVLYAELPTPGAKAKIRELIRQEMNTAVVERMDVVTARALSLLNEALTEKSTSRATVAKPVADPTKIQVEAAVRLMVAPNLLPIAEGVADDWATQASELARSLQSDVQKYREYQAQLAAWEANKADDKGDAPAEPDVNQLVKDAARIARGRKPGNATKKAAGSGPKPVRTGESYSGPRRSIADHVKSYFADKPADHFARCGEINKHASEQYAAGEASQGAISAHLFPASGKERTFDGYVAEIDASGVKGARKI